MKALANAAEQLAAGRPVSHPELVAFTDWPSIRHYAEHDPGGSDLSAAVKLIDAHTPRGVIAAIDACTTEDRAQLVVSTAHKAKGREWATVRIADDFPEPEPDPTTGDDGGTGREEAMLAYVATTRAKTTLDNTGLAWIHKDIHRKPPAAAPAVQL
jgi:superfamily I DNA/RNA helicase